MASSRNDFRLIKLAQNLFSDICEIQSVADKGYRYTVCQDIRKKSEDVVHYIRRANRLDSGSEDRIQLQFKADELLEDIKDLLPPVGKLLKIGVKYEAQIELSIEKLQNPLHNWMERDQKISVSNRVKIVRRKNYGVFYAMKVFSIMRDHVAGDQSERSLIAYEESKARYRIAAEDYKKAILSYDEALRRYRATQDRFHKDDSVLAELLAQIAAKKKLDVPVSQFVTDFKMSEETIKEKKGFESMVNGQYMKEIGDSLCEETRMKLKENFPK